MSEPKDTGGPAFPLYPLLSHQLRFQENSEGVVETDFHFDDHEAFPGMSLRDWFAGRALPYICQIGPDGSTKGATVYESVALDAYAMADAMLKARGPQ